MGKIEYNKDLFIELIKFFLKYAFFCGIAIIIGANIMPLVNLVSNYIIGHDVPMEMERYFKITPFFITVLILALCVTTWDDVKRLVRDVLIAFIVLGIVYFINLISKHFSRKANF